MPRQRSKKLSSSRTAAPPARAQAQEIDYDENESDFGSGDESQDLEVLEKDAEEDEFERLVLGDAAGWKSEMGKEMDVDVDESQSEGDDVQGDNGEGVGLEGMDDADVSRYQIQGVSMSCC